MQLNINKETRQFKLEKVDSGVKISNVYSFLFENTEANDHRYYFEVRKEVSDAEGKKRYVKDENFTVTRPKESFRVKSHKTKKKAVVITAKSLQTKSDGSSLVKPITIFAYALEDKERIIIQRKTVFIFPSKKRYDEVLNQQ